MTFNRSSSSRRVTSPPKRTIAARINQRLAIGLLCIAGCVSLAGCFVPIYSARPERRVQQLLYTSEDLRSMLDTWERFWFLDSPSHMTPIRTHGGVL
ncbi:MAG: hypothetical protein AAF539_09740 [Planctomycetota bacterium]